MNINKLKILQWNSRSVKNRHDLNNYANNYDVIIIIESWLKPNEIFNLKGFNAIRYDRFINLNINNDNTVGGGIVIFIKKSILYNQVNLNLNFDPRKYEYGAITIKTNLGDILICAFYRIPTHFNMQLNDWDLFCDAIKSYRSFILVGDFNAHHSLWGSDHNCTNDNIIAVNTDQECFFLLNDNSPTRYCFNRRNNSISFSNIDLSFVSDNLAFLSSWSILDDSWGSDHFPIEIKINIDTTNYDKVDYRLNFNKMHRELFEKKLKESAPFFNSIDFTNLNSLNRYDSFVNFLITSITESMPNSNNNSSSRNNNSNKNKKRQAIWWNNVCDKAVRIRKAAQKSLRFNCTQEKFIEFKKICAITKKTLKQEKKNSMMKFAESINRYTNILEIWKKIKM